LKRKILLALLNYWEWKNMKGRVKFILGSLIFVVIGVIFGLILSSNLGLFNNGQTQEIKISKESLDVLTKMNDALAELAAATKPAVVNITSQTTLHTQPFANPFFDDPFFRDFFGDSLHNSNKSRKYKQTGLGSGVIVEKSGYIITNNHVVQGSEEIIVRLSDKRQFKGKIIGLDPKTDLAVIKISGNNLPILNLGDSDKLKVGERVLAIGNPFGLSQTVTSGIVSAIGRADVGIVDYEDFIQTDAAINPGNSGGALVNSKGELAGINTAIFSTSGGYQGVGFAIPSNMVKVVMESLIKRGKVIRGWLGVSIQQITPQIAKQFGIKDNKGALVSEVMEDGPAKKAGIQQGDVITEMDGKEIKDPAQLKNIVAGITPGKEISVKIIRDGKEKVLPVVISEALVNMPVVAGETNYKFEGIHVQNLTSEARRMLNIPGRIKGVIITEIDGDSPAEGILAPKDVIMEINRAKIENVKDYNTAMKLIKKNEQTLLLIYRNGTSIYLTLSTE
jgi:serine protease Do